MTTRRAAYRITLNRSISPLNSVPKISASNRSSDTRVNTAGVRSLEKMAALPDNVAGTRTNPSFPACSPHTAATVCSDGEAFNFHDYHQIFDSCSRRYRRRRDTNAFVSIVLLPSASIVIISIGSVFTFFLVFFFLLPFFYPSPCSSSCNHMHCLVENAFDERSCLFFQS